MSLRGHGMTSRPSCSFHILTVRVCAATAALAHYVNQPRMMHTSGDASAITTSGPLPPVAIEFLMQPKTNLVQTSQS